MSSEHFHNDCHDSVADFVQKARASATVCGHKPQRRDFGGRVFPKAAIRALARKANIRRMSFGVPDAHGVIPDDKDTYGFIDRKTCSIMENVLYDAITIAHAMKKSSKNKHGGHIVKERHMLKALERHGGIGMGTIEGRKTMM